MSRVKALIDDYLASAGCSAREFASEVGVTESHISYIRQGKRQPSLMLINRMAEVLNMKPIDLMDAVIEDMKEDKNHGKERKS